MNPRQTSPSIDRRFERTGRWVGLLSSVFFAALTAYLYVNGGHDQTWVAAIVFVITLIANWHFFSGRHNNGVLLTLGLIGIYLMLGPLWVSGSSLINSVLIISVLGSIGILTLPLSNFGRVLMWSFIAAMVCVVLDLFGPAQRAPLSIGSELLFVIVLFLLVFILLLGREFSSLNLRTKIVLGILATGGMALAIFATFAILLSRQITDSLSKRLESNVISLAQEQLTNAVGDQASLLNQSFKDVLDAVQSVGQNWGSLQAKKYILNDGTYWDASKGLVQYENGSYGNAASEISSVYVPPATSLDTQAITDMNASAYLDFYAPTILEKYPSLLAIYAIDTRGITRYYPNIDLARVVPNGFDPRERPYYLIASPLYNPNGLSRWAIPYQDATGGGLVVTVAVPVYVNKSFTGIVAADMQLSEITKQVELLKGGETGYSFMIDDAGRILSMPPAGYQLFDIDPESINPDDFFKQSVLGLGSPELNAATTRMAAGGTGIIKINKDGVDYYVAFAPVTANSYSLALVVPVQEFETTLVSARNTTEAQIQSGIRAAIFIMLVLLLISIVISLGIGQIISSPITRLTQAANEIVDGNLNTKVEITSIDEIGNLAQSFNTMTSRLKETLQGLEQRVEERAAQLKIANEKNERRARQFEAVSQVASTISSTRDLDTLLTQVTAAISTRFGFYHVGIFLLDPRKEYAILSAANSEGGKAMLARQHRLRVGETGIVGFVTGSGKPRIVLNTGEDAVFFNNPDLPNTRSEIALPLLVENEVIGALDVQSTEANAFYPEDVNILTTLADQVAIAIQNSRQFDQTRKALAEADALSRQFVQVGWSQFTRTHNLAGVHHSGARATLLYENQSDGKETSSMQQERERNKNNHGSLLTLPLKLRGEQIGSVEVRSPDNQHWDQDDLDVVTAIIERAAIAMENARLLAESQKRANKERTIGEISARISAQSDIDQLIRTAAQELNRTLPGAEIAIQFNSEEAE